MAGSALFTSSADQGRCSSRSSCSSERRSPEYPNSGPPIRGSRSRILRFSANRHSLPPTPPLLLIFDGQKRAAGRFAAWGRSSSTDPAEATRRGQAGAGTGGPAETRAGAARLDQPRQTRSVAQGRRTPPERKRMPETKEALLPCAAQRSLSQARTECSQILIRGGYTTTGDVALCRATSRNWRWVRKGT